MKCSFSGKEIPPGTGITYVTKTGRIYYFLNRKCEKNFLKLGRIPRHVKWTEASRLERKKGEKKK